jgi:hypothetical protein
VEIVVACFKVLFQHLPGGAEEKLVKNPADVRAEIQTGDSWCPKQVSIFWFM